MTASGAPVPAARDAADGVAPDAVVPDAVVPDGVGPDAVVPDTKDWTWVLSRPCAECGFDAAQVRPAEVADRLRATTAQWVAVLARDGVRERPRPAVWSPLEYACHVRDVHRLFDERLQLMLGEDDPLFANWDQDATALASDYPSQDPQVVARDLRDSGLALADRFAAVTDWGRPARRSDGASFTIASFGAYLLHDVEHHLEDVR